MTCPFALLEGKFRRHIPSLHGEQRFLVGVCFIMPSSIHVDHFYQSH